MGREKGLNRLIRKYVDMENVDTGIFQLPVLIIQLYNCHVGLRITENLKRKTREVREFEGFFSR